MQKQALLISSGIFLVFALAHMVRYLLNIEVIIGRIVIPIFFSLPLALIAAALALWMFILTKKE